MGIERVYEIRCDCGRLGCAAHGFDPTSSSKHEALYLLEEKGWEKLSDGRLIAPGHIPEL